ncbi:MAG TPA: hydroxyisourate hydrolase [Pseudonocardia sp.]|nr:hydroxyisourate hydrolase [Pseudonocardia sp.]
MTGISTHVLDAALGRPAAGVPVVLTTPDGARRTGVTDADGRIGALSTEPPGPGVHRITFDTAAYFAATGQAGFHPEVTVAFEVTDDRPHVHVPLLLSPYSYTTYRGS